jgi:hypothetical protein
MSSWNILKQRLKAEVLQATAAPSRTLEPIQRQIQLLKGFISTEELKGEESGIGTE